jgi:YbbR domain-containing protein
VTRMVPVRPDLSFQLDKQFTTINGIQLNPDSLTVSGPDAILDTLGYISTERVDLGLLTRNYSDKIRLEKINGLELSSSRVDCDIELEKYTEVQLYIPIEVLGLPDTLSMQTFPSRIKFTCNVGLSKYDWVTDHLFSAVVDYSTVDEQKNELLVSIQNIPSFLLNYEYYPRTVEFLISRK